MNIAFAGTEYFNKIHSQTAQELETVVNHKADSMIEFGKQFEIARQYENVDAGYGSSQIGKVVEIK